MPANVPIVICKLPNAGLGNQLFPLMKARVFSHLNQFPLLVINYHQMKIGPWLRGDRTKRNYKGFFTFQRSLLGEMLDKYTVKRLDTKKQLVEPTVDLLINGSDAESYLFSAMPHYTNYFAGLSEHRSLVIELLYDFLTPEIKKRLDHLPPAAIGVHIRRGDFREPMDGEELGKRGNLRTSESYFIRMIESVRKMYGSDLSVNVFSDAPGSDLTALLKMPRVFMVEGNNDMEDLLLLSRSSLIITSASSTFSYWAAFLSDAPIIVHPTYTGIKIRPETIRNKLFEGAFDEKNDILLSKIKNIADNK